MAGTTVLVLDFDPDTRVQLAQAAERLGWNVLLPDSSLSALALLEAAEVHVAVVDLEGAGVDGLEVVRRIRRDHSAVDVVAIASAKDTSKTDEAVRLGIPEFLVRPFGMVEARRVLNRVAETRPHDDDAAKVPPHAEEVLRRLVSNSKAMRDVKQSILKMAASRMPVLILGESGTGKELVARAIHDCGPSRDEPFVPVDCGALSPNLIESELFGHVRGAFTGASQARVGMLAAAGRGTLFFDEIGELPRKSQPKLLRAIQEREIRQIGSNERTGIEARIVAATNVNLKQAVHENRFRQDLYYRLNVFSIHVPPLRERKSDILPLVHYFLDRYGSCHGVTDFSPEFMNRLMQYQWPGNVRELENSVQRALALSSGVRLDAENLPPTVLYRTESRGTQRDTERLQDLERRAIKEALEAARGDRVRAAKLLGIGKTTIYRKVREYGLDEGADLTASPD